MRTVTSRGMALIEAMLALLVVTIGLLSLASLMLKGFQHDQAALQRTHAVNIVADMLERIRANPNAAAAYDCRTYGGGPSEQGCASTNSSAGNNCTTTQLAEDDLARWQAAARATLPLTNDPCAADVAYASGAPSRYAASVSWHERGSLSPASVRSEILITPSGAP